MECLKLVNVLKSTFLGSEFRTFTIRLTVWRFPAEVVKSHAPSSSFRGHRSRSPRISRLGNMVMTMSGVHLPTASTFDLSCGFFWQQNSIHAIWILLLMDVEDVPSQTIRSHKLQYTQPTTKFRLFRHFVTHKVRKFGWL